MAEWGANEKMNELEASMWRAQRHPGNSLQGGILEVFGAVPEWDDVRRLHERGVARFPRFRQRVLEPALPVDTPVWVPDEHFDLDYHLRRATLPGSGSMTELLGHVQALGNTPLDLKRALWQATFIEGLEGGRSAYFLTVHHCLMDGQASIQLFSRLHLGQLEGLSVATADDDPGATSDPLRLAAKQTVNRVLNAPELGKRALGGAFGALRAGPVKGLRFAASVGRVLSPPPSDAGSPLMKRGTRGAWRYGVLDCGLDELKAAGRAASGTLNDAYLAGMLGGLRLYHEQAGVDLETVNVNMPVSVRREGEEGGNRFAAALLSIPASSPDPRERIRIIREVVGAARGEPALDFFSLLLPVVNRAPEAVLTPLFATIQDRADLTCSNVPGLREPVTFAGAPVEAMYCFGPLPGSSITTVLCSYAKTCLIGINIDGHAFDEPQTLFDALREGLDEVLALGPPLGERPQSVRM